LSRSIINILYDESFYDCVIHEHLSCIQDIPAGIRPVTVIEASKQKSKQNKSSLKNYSTVRFKKSVTVTVRQQQ